MRLSSIDAAVTAAGRWLSGVCLGAIFVVVLLQVFCRYVLNAPLRWPEELSSLLFVSMTFLGSVVFPSAREHLTVDVVYDHLPARMQRLIDVATDLICIVFFACLVLGSFGAMRSMAGLLMPALQIPINVSFAIVGLAAALLGYIHAVSLARRFLPAAGNA